MLFLQEHQVSTSYAAKIFKQYGNDSIKVMQENPWENGGECNGSSTDNN